ncbi:MAG: cytidylate kinase family protein, partial [Syntrophales bacterium]|nr:cytidylate kinase family protein [Syntrophales bacterium]
NYKYADKDQLLKDITAGSQKWEIVGQELDETCPTTWERYDWEYRGFISLIESRIYEYALMDKVVIIGRGSNFLLQGIPQVLKVRFIAPREKRIEHTMSKDQLDRKTAELVVEKTDHARACYAHTNYGREWEKTEYYDMVFNTEEQSHEQIVKILIETLAEKDQQATAVGRQELANRALAAKVKAKIVTNPKFLVPTLEVSHEGETIILRGVVHNPKEYHLIEAIAQEIAAPHAVRNELHYRK